MNTTEALEEDLAMPPTPDPPIPSFTSSSKTTSFLSGTKSLIISNSAIPIILSNVIYFDKELKPAYRDFEFIFICENTVYDLKTTSLLNKAIQNNINEITIIRKNNKKFTLDLLKNEQFDHSKNKRSEIKRFNRPPLWYYRTPDGTIQSYDHDVNMTLCNHLLKTQNKPTPIRLVIRSKRHELDIPSRSDFNMDTKEGLQIFTDREIIKKFHWIPEFDYTGIKEMKTDKLPFGSDEFSKVADLFYFSMPRRAKGVNEDITEIISIEKIFNPKLRRNWEHELENVQIANDNPKIIYTRMLFHGTGACDPKIIYEDDKGFLINFASDDGLWGRGVYFAQDASYSHKYTFRTPSNTCKMILAQVITGDGITLDEDRNIRLPPLNELNESGKKRFDCVLGMRHGTFIYVCYDNGRAYPTYVIEYIRRDI